MQYLDYLTSLKSTQQMSDIVMSQFVIAYMVTSELHTYIHDKLLSLSMYCSSLYDFTNNTK